MNKGILIVYNTCTIGRVSHEGWNKDIDSILSQDFKDYDVIVSECRGSRTDIDDNVNVSKFIERATSNGFLYNITREQLSCFATLNHSLRQAVKKRGPYEYYMHMTSGIEFPTKDFFTSLYSWLKSNEDVGRAILAIEGTDNFFPPPFGYPYDQKDTDDGAYPPESLNTEPLQITPGYAAAEHCWVYPHKMYESYGERVAPGMYISNGAGALYSYLMAAIGKKNSIVPWNVVPRLVHKRTQDGPTKMPYPDSWWIKHRTLEEVNKFTQRLDENCVFVDTYCAERSPKWVGRTQQHLSEDHKKAILEKFGEDGLALSDKERDDLRKFLKQEFFVTEDIIDYDNINSTLIE